MRGGLLGAICYNLPTKYGAKRDVANGRRTGGRSVPLGAYPVGNALAVKVRQRIQQRPQDEVHNVTFWNHCGRSGRRAVLQIRHHSLQAFMLTPRDPHTCNHSYQRAYTLESKLGGALAWRFRSQYARYCLTLRPSAYSWTTYCSAGSSKLPRPALQQPAYISSPEDRVNLVCLPRPTSDCQ
mgnify:CR=1 FL=1